MNCCWETICSAIGAGLLREPFIKREDVDWEEVYVESKKQGISGIVLRGTYGYVPEDIRNKWKLYNYQVVTRNMKVLREEDDLVKLLGSQNIRYCILKGTASAIYYPEPQLRTVGDIDFIVPEEYFDNTKELLVTQGYLLDEKEENNPRHVKFTRNNVVIEMHHYFADNSTESCILRRMDELVIGTIRGVQFPMLPKLENGIVLLEHLRQHLLEGVGIRQVLDWMMYVNAVVDDQYWNDAFETEISNLGLKTLAVEVTRMCQLYMGLSSRITWCMEADEDLCRRLMENIIHSGNFGQNYGDGQKVEKTIVNLKGKGIFSYLQQAGEYNWAAYKKHSWLRPFAWLYQISRYITQLRQIRRNKDQLKDDLMRGSERYRLLKDLDIK